MFNLFIKQENMQVQIQESTQVYLWRSGPSTLDGGGVILKSGLSDLVNPRHIQYTSTDFSMV